MHDFVFGFCEKIFDIYFFFFKLVQGQTEYLSGSAQALSAIDSCLANVNRTAVRNWPRCITDPAQSSFGGSSSLDIPEQGSGAPPQMNSQPMNSHPMSNQPMGNQPMGNQPMPGQASMGGQPQVSNSTFDPNAQSSIPLQKSTQPSIVKARALYPFQGQDASELTFQFNEEIIVLRQGGEWWEGELNGRRGLFPSNYVKLV